MALPDASSCPATKLLLPPALLPALAVFAIVLASSSFLLLENKLLTLEKVDGFGLGFSITEPNRPLALSWALPGSSSSAPFLCWDVAFLYLFDLVPPMYGGSLGSAPSGCANVSAARSSLSAFDTNDFERFARVYCALGNLLVAVLANVPAVDGLAL